MQLWVAPLIPSLTSTLIIVTTIACTPTAIASDSMCSDEFSWISVPKLFRIGDLGVLGIAGEYQQCLRFKRWLRAAALVGGITEDEPPKMDRCEAVFIDGERILYYEGTPEPMRVLDSYMAIGSGMQYALGAMHQGATVVEAVKAARYHDIKTGGKIKCRQVAPPPPPNPNSQSARSSETD